MGAPAPAISAESNMISRALGYFEEGFLNLLITLMTVLVFVEVVARFFFNTGFLWMQELTLTFVVGLSSLACHTALKSVPI